MMFHVETEQRILIPNIKVPVRNDRVRPARLPAVIRKVEATDELVGRGTGLN